MREARAELEKQYEVGEPSLPPCVRADRICGCHEGTADERGFSVCEAVAGRLQPAKPATRSGEIKALFARPVPAAAPRRGARRGGALQAACRTARRRRGAALEATIKRWSPSHATGWPTSGKRRLADAALCQAKRPRATAGRRPGHA